MTSHEDTNLIYFFTTGERQVLWTFDLISSNILLNKGHPKEIYFYTLRKN